MEKYKSTIQCPTCSLQIIIMRAPPNLQVLVQPDYCNASITITDIDLHATIHDFKSAIVVINSTGNVSFCNYHLYSYLSNKGRNHLQLQAWVFVIFQTFICAVYGYGLQNAISKTHMLSLYSKKVHAKIVFCLKFILCDCNQWDTNYSNMREPARIGFFISVVNDGVHFNVYDFAVPDIVDSDFVEGIMDQRYQLWCKYEIQRVHEDLPEGKMRIILFVSLTITTIGLCFIFLNKMIIRRIELGALCSLVWVFQIIHNVREHNKKLPNIVYIVGTSANTLFYSIYQCSYPYNFFEFEPNITGAIVIVLLHALSVIMLLDSFTNWTEKNQVKILPTPYLLVRIQLHPKL